MLHSLTTVLVVMVIANNNVILRGVSCTTHFKITEGILQIGFMSTLLSLLCCHIIVFVQYAMLYTAIWNLSTNL